MRLFRPGLIGRCLYPEALFRIKTTEKLLCLTFDDGPSPETTPGVAELLDAYNIKALFFCDGMAAEKYPSLISLIKSKGHLIGNHGYNHPDGWKNSSEEYIDNVKHASEFTSSQIFRPPYGHLRHSQYSELKKTFQIFFWDIMPYDFDESLGAEKSFNILIARLRPGSIIVLHDHPKSTLLPLLEKIIESAIKKEYRFELPR